MLFGTHLTRRDVMKAAHTIRQQDGLAMAAALRRAWAWARQKGERLAREAARAVADIARRVLAAAPKFPPKVVAWLAEMRRLDATNPPFARPRGPYLGRRDWSAGFGR